MKKTLQILTFLVKACDPTRYVIFLLRIPRFTVGGLVIAGTCLWSYDYIKNNFTDPEPVVTSLADDYFKYIKEERMIYRVLDFFDLEHGKFYESSARSVFAPLEQEYCDQIAPNAKMATFVDHNLNTLLNSLSKEQVDKLTSIHHLSSLDDLKNDELLAPVVDKATKIGISLFQLQSYARDYANHGYKLQSMGLEPYAIVASNQTQGAQSLINLTNPTLGSQELTRFDPSLAQKSQLLVYDPTSDLKQVTQVPYKDLTNANSNNSDPLALFPDSREKERLKQYLEMLKQKLELDLQDPNLSASVKNKIFSKFKLNYTNAIMEYESICTGRLYKFPEDQLLDLMIKAWTDLSLLSARNLRTDLQAKLAHDDFLIKREQDKKEYQTYWEQQHQLYEVKSSKTSSSEDKSDSKVLDQDTNQDLEQSLDLEFAQKQERMEHMLDLQAAQDNQIQTVALEDNFDLLGSFNLAYQKLIPQDYDTNQILAKADRDLIEQQLEVLDLFIEQKLTKKQLISLFKVQFATLNKEDKDFIINVVRQEMKTLFAYQGVAKHKAKEDRPIGGAVFDLKEILADHCLEAAKLDLPPTLNQTTPSFSQEPNNNLALKKVKTELDVNLDNAEKIADQSNLTTSLNVDSSKVLKDPFPFFKQANLFLDPNARSFLIQRSNQNELLTEIENKLKPKFMEEARVYLGLMGKDDLTDADINQIIKTFYPPLSDEEYKLETNALRAISGVESYQVLNLDKKFMLYWLNLYPTLTKGLICKTNPHIDDIVQQFKSYRLDKNNKTQHKERAKKQLSLNTMIAHAHSVSNSLNSNLNLVSFEQDISNSTAKQQDLFSKASNLSLTKSVSYHSFEIESELKFSLISLKAQLNSNNQEDSFMTNEQQLAQIREDTRRLQEHYFKLYQQRQKQQAL